MEFGRVAKALRVDPKSSLAIISGGNTRQLQVVIDLNTVILALEAYSEEDR